MITCEIIVEEAAPGRVQMAVIPRPRNATDLEERMYLQLQEALAAKLEQIFGMAKAGEQIVGELSLEPAVRARIEAIRQGDA